MFNKILPVLFMILFGNFIYANQFVNIPQGTYVGEMKQVGPTGHWDSGPNGFTASIDANGKLTAIIVAHTIAPVYIAQANLVINSVQYDPAVGDCVASGASITGINVSNILFSNCSFNGKVLSTNFTGTLSVLHVKFAFSGTVNIVMQ